MTEIISLTTIRQRMAERATVATADLPVVRQQNPELVQATLDALPADSEIKQLRARIHADQAAPATYAPQAVDTPAGADASPTDLSDTARQGLARAKYARTGIETLNFGASVQQAALRALNDEDLHERLRKAYGEDRLAGYLKVQQRLLKDGLEMASHGAEYLKNGLSVSGELFTIDSAGAVRTGQYELKASGPGWSVQVNHLGQAQVIADGVDLSSRVSTSRSTGESWSNTPLNPGASIYVTA